MTKIKKNSPPRCFLLRPEEMSCFSACSAKIQRTKKDSQEFLRRCIDTCMQRQTAPFAPDLVSFLNAKKNTPLRVPNLFKDPQ